MKLNKILVVSSALVFALLGSGSVFAADESLKGDPQARVDAINSAIAAKGAKWVAGRTEMAEMPVQDQENMFGLSFEPLNIGAAPLPMGRAVLPESLDWRANNGNFVTEPRNQGRCGSCWAFSMTGALESYSLRTKNTPNRELDLSEQVMVSCSGSGSCKGGRLNADYIKTTGLPPESYYPYTQTDGSCSNVKPGWESETYKIGRWGSVTQSVNAIKTALNKYGPLPTGYLVYEDFLNYKSGIYTYTTGERKGGHAVLIVGYNDAEKYFIVKNSWGPSWGENGFFRIAYSEMENEVMFGMSTIAYYNPVQRAK
ncbi:MAG: C1 family peptidase [Elusimicrobiaceae bacterium]|nr:C1 family peptidase [Elusimicrobiaceae bacterium]